MDTINATIVNRTWLAFANEDICNHRNAIKQMGYINWVMGTKFRFSIGDTVYLFMSDKREVCYKMVVVEKDCERTDKAFGKEEAPNDKTYKLSLVMEYKGDKLNEENLKAHGFSSGKSIQTPSYRNEQLIAYIDSVFDEVHNQVSDLQCKPIIYVDLGSGSYWDDKIGHEYFNLVKNPTDKRYYGYCPPYGNINISNLGANKSDKLISGVIVVYTKKAKDSSNREIIAFCKDATIHRTPIDDIKTLQALKRKLPDSSGIYCSYSIESDELVDLSQVSSKFVIHIADYNVSMFRAQRFFKGKYKDLDKKVIAYIASYLYGGNDDNEFDFQESVQNADVDVSLVNTAAEEPEYADGNNCKVVKKNSRISKLVLVNSQYQCAADNTHTTFNTAKGVPYMEGHHLIPCTYSNAQNFWKTKGRNIDCVENIVCLCPTCHRKIHFGSSDEKRKLIKLLYEKQIEKLSDANIAISLNELYTYYGL